MTSSKRKTSSAPRARDATVLLKEDHGKAKKLFRDFQKLKKDGGSESQKSKLVEQVCTALTIHAQVEEEIFYPAVRTAIESPDLMDEADVEHAGAKDLIRQLRGMHPADGHYDAMVKVLGEEVNHHVKEEEGKMFPKVKKAKLDTKALGARIMERMRELEADLKSPSHREVKPSPFTVGAPVIAGLR